MTMVSRDMNIDPAVIRQYLLGCVQYSSGCPFTCEFCDIIVTFGRKPRAKAIAQIERELDLLRAHNVRNVFFIDDNLIGHLPRCRELLDFLDEYQRRHAYRFTFGAETSANVSRLRLIDACIALAINGERIRNAKPT